MPNRIREYRNQADMTLEQLAELVETSPAQISRLERGDRKLTQDWMERIGRALSISPGALLVVPPSAPDTSEVLYERSEVALLRFWRGLSDPERELFLKMLGAPAERDDDAA